MFRNFDIGPFQTVLVDELIRGLDPSSRELLVQAAETFRRLARFHAVNGLVSLAGNGWIFGLAMAVLVAVVIIGGIQSIARVTSKLVPLMAILYVGCGVYILAVDYANIPNCTYCHPEVASVGLTEEQCKEQKLDYKVGRFPFSANGRARATDQTDGFVKIIRDSKYGEILGAHIVCGHASEMIGELVMARTNEYTVEEVDLAIHAHPTLSEGIAEAALDSMGRAVHI